MIGSRIKGVVAGGTTLKVTTNGKPFTTFNLEVEGVAQEAGVPEVKIVFVKTWNELAESVADHLKKGTEIKCTGRWDTRDYEGRDGNMRKWTEFIAFEIARGDAILGSKGFSVPSESDPDADITPTFAPEVP